MAIRSLRMYRKCRARLFCGEFITKLRKKGTRRQKFRIFRKPNAVWSKFPLSHEGVILCRWKGEENNKSDYWLRYSVHHMPTKDPRN